MKATLKERKYQWGYSIYEQHDFFTKIKEQIMQDFGVYATMPTWLMFSKADQIDGGLWYLDRAHDHDVHVFAGLSMQLIDRTLIVQMAIE